MKQAFYLILACILLSACSTRRKVVKTENVSVKTEESHTEQKKSDSIDIDWNSFRKVAETTDEVVEVERIIYDTARKDTLIPKEFIRYKRTTKKANEVESADSARVTIVQKSDTILETASADSTHIIINKERTTKSAFPFYIFVSIFIIIGLFIGWLFRR